jgi:hypothetical protein
MKSLFVFINLFIVLCTAFGQTQNIPGYNNQLPEESIDKIYMQKPNIQEVIEKANYVEKGTGFYQISELYDVSFDMQNAGSWTIMDNGTQIWRLSINYPDAQALDLYFDELFIPQGASLHVYNENRKQLIPAITSERNLENNLRTSTSLIQGETAYLEYIQPSNISGTPQLHIFKIAYAFRGCEQLISRFQDEKITCFGDSEECEVNINCPEGNNWQNEKRGIALIYLVQGDYGGGFCTGSLINNLANDHTPYFLTAEHCGGDSEDMDLWEFYFNYEADGCDNPANEPDYNTLFGCTYRASGPFDGGSDFLLVELNQAPPTSYNVSYNGWSLDETNITNGVSIHHPNGDIKKISTYTEQPTISTFFNCFPNAHWEINWAGTPSGHGVTEPGSNGAPLFNQNGKIIGTLTGGAGSCSNPSGINFFGRMAFHWDTNGTSAENRLRDWLDPNNTMATSCPPLVDFFANFSISNSYILVEDSIMVCNQSIGDYINHKFFFPGGSPNMSIEDTSYIVYNTPGYYDITLEIYGANDTAVLSIEDAVQVVGEPAQPHTVDFMSPIPTQVEDHNINFYNLSSAGADSVEWFFTGANTPHSTEENPYNISYPFPGYYDVSLKVYYSDTTITVCKPDYIHILYNDDIDMGDIWGYPRTILTNDSVLFEYFYLFDSMADSVEWFFEGGNPANVTSDQVYVNYEEAGRFDALAHLHQDGLYNPIFKNDYVTVCVDSLIIHIDTCFSYTDIDSVFANLSDSITNMIEISIVTFQGEYSFEYSPEPLEPNSDYLIILEIVCDNYKNNPEIYITECVLNTDALVSTNSKKNNKQIVYPNPTTGQLFINENQKIQKILLKDANGKTLKIIKNPESVLDISNFPKGNYILELSTKDAIYVNKIVLQ